MKKGSAAAKAWGRKMARLRKGGTTVVKRKSPKNRTVKKKSAYTQNPVGGVNRKVSRRRGFHRNPPKGLGGLMFYFSPTRLMGGVVDAGEVLVGKVVVRTLPGMVGLPTTDMMGMLSQAVTAVLAGGVAHSFVSANAGKMILAGGLSAPLESFVKGMNIPVVSAALGEDTVEVGTGVSSYPEITNQVGAYPQMGEEAYEYATQQ